MRNALLGLVLLACVPAHAQPPGQQPAGATQPKAPTAPLTTRPSAPVVPEIAGGDVITATQIALIRAAQDARDDLKSLMDTVSDANRQRSTGATSNPCERPGRGSSLSCVDGIKRDLARANLPKSDRTQIDQELSLLRQDLLDAQAAGPAKRRAARLAEATERAGRIDALLARLTEPKPAPKAALPLDKLIPGLGD